MLELGISRRPDSRFARCLQGGGVAVSCSFFGCTVSIVTSQIYGNNASQVRAHVQNFPSPDGEIAKVLASTHACTQLRPTLRSTTGCTCRRDLQYFPSPRWEIADALATTHACTTANTLWSTTVGTCRRDLEHFPSRACAQKFPMGIPADLPNRLSSFNWDLLPCSQEYAPATPAKPHRPDWKSADALASTLATTAADASVNFRMYVPQLKFSHRPDGKLSTCLHRLSLSQLRLTIRSTTGGTYRRDLQISHRPDGRLTFESLVVCRVLVSMSSLAQ